MLLAKLNVLKSLNSVASSLRSLTIASLILMLVTTSLIATAKASNESVEGNADENTTLALQTVVQDGGSVTADIDKVEEEKGSSTAVTTHNKPSNAEVDTIQPELSTVSKEPSLSRLDRPEVGKHVAANNLDAGSMLVSLLMVLALIVIAATILKKFRMVPQLGQGMKVITSMHLGPKERLVVVEVNEKQLLLGVTAHNISILQQLETPLTPAQPLPTELASGLSKLLKK